MGKNKYIETPEILNPEMECELPLPKHDSGFYRPFPNSSHIGGKNELRKIAKSKVKEGYVYLVRIQGTGKCKIGVSTKPRRRLADIYSMIPFDIELLALNRVKLPYHFEEETMSEFKDKFIRNEWFELSINDMKSIMIKMHNQQVKDYATT